VSFITTDFLLFFPVVAALYWVLRNHRWQNRFLLVASYVFYGWVHPWMTLLLFGVTGMNYLAGRAMAARPERKDRILATVVVLSVLNLCVFKYYGWFAADILPRFLGPEEAGRWAEWQLLLPLGLSFYTFHNLSYSIEVYRGRFAVKTDPVEYFLYGSYFPQLVAGPVERAAHLMPQLEGPRRFEGARFASGFGLLLWGAFKKVALADAISPFVDVIFISHDPSWAMVWTGALGFTIQALADFSGYTDIARGASRMLGIELMDNFDHPYLAASPMEFWQRWHISFSTWLRDYVYVPACFSEWVRRWITIPFTGEWGPFATTSRALLITMLVSGMWHGSTWNYLLWGFYYFVIGTLYAAIVAKLPRRWKKDARWRVLAVPLMFCFTVFGMQIFREPSVPRLLHNLTLNPLEGTPEQWTVSAAMLGVCAYAALPLIVALLVNRYLRPRLVLSPAWPALRATTWAVFAVAVFASVRMSATDFIYFQF
jgi:alginate O-acetyltransferase complex protein AlgI